MDVGSSFKIPQQVKPSQLGDSRYDTILPEINLNAREIKEGITLEQAVAATQSNGLDEVFFSQGDKLYVAYSEGMGGDDQNRIKNLNFGEFNGQQAKILAVSSEVNTLSEGFNGSFKLIGSAISKPLSYIKMPNAATAATFAGGVVLGALSQAPLGSTGKIGLALGGVSGASTIRYLTEKGPDSPAKAVKAGATGVAAVAIGAALPHGIKWVAQTSLPKALAAGTKTTLMAATIGTGIAVVGSSLAGAMSTGDYQSLKDITK